MSLEQVPGTCPLKITQGDDATFLYNLPFDGTLYSFEMIVHECNNGEFSIPLTASVQSSVLTILQAKFYASTTSALDITSAGKYHSYFMRWTDASGLKRKFAADQLEVV
jgi:hypothetical protein